MQVSLLLFQKILIFTNILTLFKLYRHKKKFKNCLTKIDFTLIVHLTHSLIAAVFDNEKTR